MAAGVRAMNEVVAARFSDETAEIVPGNVRYSHAHEALDQRHGSHRSDDAQASPRAFCSSDADCQHGRQDDAHFRRTERRNSTKQVVAPAGGEVTRDAADVVVEEPITARLGQNREADEGDKQNRAGPKTLSTTPASQPRKVHAQNRSLRPA